MLLPSVRHALQAQRDVDPYAAWVVAVRRFRNDWAGGKRPDVHQLRDYLHEVPEQQRSEALQDLIAEHLRVTWQVGYGLYLERYFAEFSEDSEGLTSAMTVPADVVEDEFLARYQRPYGDTPPVDEYEERFPARPDVIRLLRQRCLGEGRYVKTRKRGQGAMGEVWEAYDRQVEQSVAIKEPRTGRADDADFLRRFAEEARITAGLEHPNIVCMHECSAEAENGAAPFYVMRLVNGPTLHERIKDYHGPPMDRTPAQKRLLWSELLGAFVSCCDALTYAHASGVLHGDLKPGNIVVGESGEAVVLDWGVAKRIPLAVSCSSGPDRASRLTAPDTATGISDDEEPAVIVAGTPDYMPPEQVDGITDARSDVFGLGAILYEMLTDRSPHGWAHRRRPADWPRIVREARFRSPRRLKFRTPRALSAISLKALARDPAKRYQSAAELADDVRRYLGGERVAARVEPIRVRAWRWLRRHGPVQTISAALDVNYGFRGKP